MNIPTGTKSLLFGVHQFLIHPWFVFISWNRLYGWPKDWRIYLSILIHDWGYWNCRSMDGSDGKNHPYLAAGIMLRLCGPKWHDFCLFHSRSVAKRWQVEPSRLCDADKYATCMYPNWLYLLLARMSGEINEYLAEAYKAGLTVFLPFYAEAWAHAQDESTTTYKEVEEAWLNCLKEYMNNYIEENSNG